MAGRKKGAVKQDQLSAQGSSRSSPTQRKEKSVRKIIEEKTDSEFESDTAGESSAGEEVEGWWKAGKKGRKVSKVSFICRGGDVECGKAIMPKESSIQCDACGDWFHPDCQGLCKGAFKALAEYDLMWICMVCRERLADTLNVGKQVETRVAEAEKKIIKKVVEAKLQAAAEMEAKLEASIRSLKADVTKQVSGTSVSLKQVMKTREQEEKVDRTCNIIVHNIPESNSEEPGIRKKHDMTKVQEMACALGLEGTQRSVENAFRLGKKVANEEHVIASKPRLLLVKLQSKDQVEKLLEERFKLKENGFPNIYITRDLPLEERERQRKLRAELQQKGRDTHKIVRGKVVPKN